MKKFLKCFGFYFLLLFLLEIIYKVAIFNTYISIGHLYTAVFTILYALFFTILTIILPKKASFILNLILLIITTFIFIAEAMFSHIFDTTFSIYSLNMADQAFDFRRILYAALIDKCFMIICFLIPLILFIIFYKKIYYKIQYKSFLKYMGIYIIVYVLVILLLQINKNSSYSAYSLYFDTHAPTLTVSKLGLITEFKLDIKRFIFGFEPKIDIVENKDDEANNLIEEIIEYNQLELNFEESPNNSITNLNNYFSNKKSTNKNEYTGIFKDKNIIYILAEGFNSIAVDEDITPTLYKMVNSSFVFKNYYAPVFMSTTGGEFQFSTGLIPTQQTLNKWKSGKTNFLYSIGHTFNDMGYETFAFHNWTYSYYKRQVTMPTLGFETYKGCGNGLEKRMNCKIWPPSDIQLIESTINDYINKEKFAVHYITVSGHSEYNFIGNNMALKNKKLVENLEYSTPVKAYLATQIELDKAIELLLNKLEEANKLEDTVIVLSGDHYPYTLNINQINEISTYERDTIFEINNSNLIIYNPSQETTIVDKLATSVDVLPTILNMFGYDYDSRLLMGSDIMSDHDSLVIFSDYSWITEKGRYNATTNTFIPVDGIKIEEGYISDINREVQNRINVSTQIVENNYYTKILATLDTKN